MLKERGHQLDSNSLVVDFNLPVIMPYGIAFDISREISSKIGTTCRGVGPTVEDFVNRYNSIRLNDLFDKNKLEEKLELILENYRHYSHYTLLGKPVNKILGGFGVYLKKNFYYYITFEKGVHKQKINDVVKVDIGINYCF